MRRNHGIARTFGRRSAKFPESFGNLVIELVPKARRMALLNQVVTTEILPRLALSRQAAARLGRDENPARVTTFVDTGELVRLLLVQDASAGIAFIEQLLARGITIEALYTGILPDAARWLGLMWDEDRCDFARVTIAVGRLQQAARMLSPRFHAASVNRADALSLLLLPAPGEQHTFGLQILAEFFQRAGWRSPAGRNAPPSTRPTWCGETGSMWSGFPSVQSGCSTVSPKSSVRYGVRQKIATFA